MPAEDWHVTQIYSKKEFDRSKLEKDMRPVTVSGGARSIQALGDEGAVALVFESQKLTDRWNQMIEAGAESDHPSFTGHTTITWDAGDLDLSKVEPFTGDLYFGPEQFAEINEDWKNEMVEKIDFEIAKVDSLGIVYGWGMISKIDGQEYYDTQGDHIPDEVGHRAVVDFMSGPRESLAMHEGASVGYINQSFYLTDDLAKSFGIECNKRGWLVGMIPDSDDILHKYRNGTYSGFSIGGNGEFQADA